MPNAVLASELRRLVRRFLTVRRAEGFSPATVVVDERALGRFAGWIADEKDELRSLVEIDRRVLEDYVLYLALVETDEGRHLKASSRLTYLGALRVFFRWLEAEGKLLRDPSRGLALPKVTKPLPRGVLSVREVERVLVVPDLTTTLGLRDRAILELLYSSGIRNAELRALAVDAIDLGEGLVTVRRGKGGKGRVVPLGTRAGQTLARYLEKARPALLRLPSESALFLTIQGRPLSKPLLVRLVRAIGREAGLRKPLTCHGLRHTCATELLRGGADLRYIQAILGHQSLLSTQVYTHVAAADLKRVHARCHPREQR